MVTNVISPTRTELVAVRFQKLGKLYHFTCTDFPDLQASDHVIVETARGQQLGQVMGFVAPERALYEYRPMLRVATPRDLVLKQVWDGKTVEALITCREQAARLGGYEQCKFVEAQYSFDGGSLTILFSTGEEDRDRPGGRINTNRLRTALSNIYPKTSIELRQIGARDVAKSLGGMGACGIPRCCSTFLTEFSPISIKMAKAQGISLDPTEITGMCGRLRCCLIYEYEQYVQARKDLPRRNKTVGTPHGEGKVLDVHPLQDAVTVLVGEMQYLVPREQLVPLDELNALQTKAEAGCSKHEGGGCDCGAKRGGTAKADADESDDIGDNDD
ncbi:MAG: PSP1 domain-containing protein [Aggregatilineales bacterium]